MAESHYSRIPISIKPFNGFANCAINYLTEGTPETNAVRLGIQDSDLQVLVALRDRWNPLFALYENKRSSRTLLVTDQLHAIIADWKAYDKEHHLLDRIAASPNVTVTDLSTFNIKSGPLAKPNHSRPTKPITTLVLPEIKQLGGGTLELKCANSDDNRIAIIEDASQVEVRYQVGPTAPTSASDPMLRQTASTHARFSLDLGAENSGKTAYLYFRWINSKYPALAGPWSNLSSVFIL